MFKKLLLILTTMFKPKLPPEPEPHRLEAPALHELAVGVWPIRQLSESGSWSKFVISDDFERAGPGAKRGGGGHYGLDLMRRLAVSRRTTLPPEYARHYYCPSDKVQAVACVYGRVIRVYTDRNGTAVYLLHGRYMSVYRHLKNVRVKEGAVLEEGAFIGIVSHALKNPRGINHLHYELWDTDRRGRHSQFNRAAQAIDPEPFLKKWERA